MNLQNQCSLTTACVFKLTTSIRACGRLSGCEASSSCVSLTSSLGPRQSRRSPVELRTASSQRLAGLHGDVAHFFD